MVDPKEITKAFELVEKIVNGIVSLQKQHNIMLLDLYERIAKLEEKNGKKD